MSKSGDECTYTETTKIVQTKMDFNFQNAFQPATPPYTDSSGAEFDEAISSLLDQSPNGGESDFGNANELNNWLETQPIFNAYEDPFQSLQAGLMGDSVGVDPRQGLMLPELQSLQDLQAVQGVQPQPDTQEDVKPKATKRKAGESAAVTKKQKSDAQKRA